MKISIRSFFITFISLTILVSGCTPAATPVPPTSKPLPTKRLLPTKTPVPTTSPTPKPYTPDPQAVKLLEEAFSFSKQGKDERAIETYTKAIEVDPLFGQPYINRGAVYADNGELEKAIADFNKGLELDPTNILGHSNRAQAYINTGKLDEALEDIKSILSLTNDEEKIKMALYLGGSAYESKGETFLALAAYSAALEIDESFLPALLFRGQHYFNQNDWLRAFSDLALALETTEDPEIVQVIGNVLMRVYPEGTTMGDAMSASEVYYDQATEYHNNGDIPNEIASLSKAIEIDPLNPDYYYFRSLRLAGSGEFEKAISDMNYSIALLPSDPLGYYYRGLMEAEISLMAEGIADLEKALEFDISSEKKTTANQLLEELNQRQESCKFTAFEAVNDAKVPSFVFTFHSPPNTNFMISASNKNLKDNNIVMFGLTPEDGVAPAGIEYNLNDGETTPIELNIRVSAGDCSLQKTVIWPEIDILALLSIPSP